MLSLDQVISQKKSIPKIRDLMNECEAYEFMSFLPSNLESRPWESKSNMGENPKSWAENS